jgi:hypothetical protein
LSWRAVNLFKGADIKVKIIRGNLTPVRTQPLLPTIEQTLEGRLTE